MKFYPVFSICQYRKLHDECPVKVTDGMENIHQRCLRPGDPYSPIVYNKEELGEVSFLVKIMARLILLRPNYWIKYADNDTILIVTCGTKKTQAIILEKLAKKLQKGLAPDDSELEQIIKKRCTIDFFLEKSEGMELICIKENQEKRKELQKQGLKVLLLHQVVYPQTIRGSYDYITSLIALGSQNDNVQRDGPLIPPSLEKINPDLHKYLMTRDISDFDPTKVSAGLKESIWRGLRRKSCYTCKNEPVSKKCSKCSAVYYCNADCQRKDWPKHKEACETMRVLKIMMSSFSAADDSD